MSVPSKLLVALILAGSLAAAAPAAAVPPRVNDEAKFFSTEAIDNANRVISQIDRQYHRGLLIETVTAVPQELQARLDESGKETFFEKWAAERAEKAELRGILCVDLQGSAPYRSGDRQGDSTKNLYP